MPLLDLLTIFVTSCLASFASSYTITGVAGGVNTVTGQRPFRQEFSTFKDSGPAFDLYILSLQQLQQQNQSALLSYYQVAGIHGHPYIAWDGVQGGYQAGYCTHGSILFPSWHRPYMLLYEQLLWNNAQQIAATYPAAQRSTYQMAATSFRVPYWDWAINATMPDPVNDPMITINTPQGTLSIINPLYNYTFHPHPSAADLPPTDTLAPYKSTLRYPDFATGQSQPSLANAQLQANAEAIQTLTYQLIADQSDYAPFSNTGYTDARGDSYNSLENMHNAIHAMVGNGGHMSIIPYSGFDPIFWLHHANVDRLFAIWQAIYPDSYTTPEVNAEGTFTIAPGSNDTISSPLTPFHSDGYGTLYTSATARSTRPFGYTYPEVVDWGVNATQLSSNVRTALNNLYNPTGSISTRSISHKHYQRYSNLTGADPHPKVMTSRSSTREYQYFVNIRVHRSALHRPFFIHFFLGPVPTNPLTWSHASTLIATHSILYYPPSTSAPAITLTTSFSSNTTTTYGQLPLTPALSRILNIPPTTPPHTIESVLKSQLSWRIQDFENRSGEVEVGEVSGLRVFVVGREVLERARGDRFAKYGGWMRLRGATGGKVGGMEEGEGM